MTAKEGQGEGQGQGEAGKQGSGARGTGAQRPGSGTSKSQTAGSNTAEGGNQAGEHQGQTSKQAGAGESGQGESRPGADRQAQSGGEPGSKSGTPNGSSNQAGQPAKNGEPGAQNGEQGGPGQGQRPGGAGRSDTGAGKAEGGEPGADMSEKNEPPEAPRANEADNRGGDTVAPEGQSQSDLFLRKLDDALKSDAKAKDLENATGLSRENIEQFMRKYEKAKAAPAGPGREITVKDQEQKGVEPSANLPGLDKSIPFSSKSRRDRGSAAQDQVRDNVEGVRFEPPPEMRAKWEGYKNKLSKVAAPKRTSGAATRTGP